VHQNAAVTARYSNLMAKPEIELVTEEKGEERVRVSVKLQMSVARNNTRSRVGRELEGHDVPDLRGDVQEGAPQKRPI
jgi:hypothetical protein